MMIQGYRWAVLAVCCSVIYGLMSISHFVFAAGEDVGKGKSIYQAKCVACHGAQGKGDGPLGPVLKPPAGNFKSAESKKKSAEELRGIIENGKPMTTMVAWKKQLSDTEIQDVLAYVLTLRK